MAREREDLMREEMKPRIKAEKTGGKGGKRRKNVAGRRKGG